MGNFPSDFEDFLLTKHKVKLIATYPVRSYVSMPFQAYISFLLKKNVFGAVEKLMCQCPFGLIPHFYRCPIEGEVNSWVEVSMPSRAYTSFLRIMSAAITQERLYEVSMPSRAYTSFLRYPFKNLGFMRFPEPVFAGIYQNILTTAVFRAC